MCAAPRRQIRMALLSCPEFNGVAEKAHSFEPRTCNSIACCCGAESRILHFKGGLKVTPPPGAPMQGLPVRVSELPS
eukprot:5228185-Pyramimonas_sp.AAC.2